MKRPVSISPVHLQHLIKVAVEDFAGPTDADRVATHQAGDGPGIEIVDQQLHVLFQFIVVAKVGSETGDGQIGDAVEIVEHDPEMFLQLAFVIRSQLWLRTGQNCAHRIVNQMKRKIAAIT